MIDEKEVTAYVTIPDCFLQGCSEDIVIFRADGGKANSERNKPISDWEEWQANTLGAAILLPENLIKQGMYLFSLGEKIECLNKIYYPSVYKRFDALADFLGCSKKALAIRMKQLGLLKKEYLDNPFDLVTVYPEVSEL